MANILNIAAYQFATLTDLTALRLRLLTLCRESHIKGTILLSIEGINLFVAAETAAIERLLTELRGVPGLEDLQPIRSATDHQPFTRMLVRLKREIIAFGVPGIEPVRRTSPKISAQELKRWLDEGRPLTLLDTRNDYEVKLGTFDHALALGIDHFRDFPAAVAKLPPGLKDRPIVMFCTGGIRCEKAGPYMESQGYQHILQLDGGILKYFEECGGAHYHGECFVFDQRVGVDPNLQETCATQCYHCLTPLNETDQQDSRYVPGKSCPHCYQTAAEHMATLIATRHAAIVRVTTPLPGSMPYDNFKPLVVPQSFDGKTLLALLTHVLGHLPTDYWQQECTRGLMLNARHEPTDAAHIVRAGERYLHKFPNLVEPDVNTRIAILHEDAALIVLNKPAPLPMHAGGRFYRNTLQYLLEQVYQPQKPRPAHRLDANTTGLVLVARTRHYAGQLQPQFENGQVVKHYLVRVKGQPPSDAFSCDAPISAQAGSYGKYTVDWANGLAARTDFRVLQRNLDDTSLLEARPLTGRTNQIRIHCAQLGHPVWGDATYRLDGELAGPQTLATSEPPLGLHAWRLAFVHPLTAERVEFCAPAPPWAGDLAGLGAMQ
jgi:UPF0176 protein